MIELARRVAGGESLYSLREELGVSKNLLHRRQRSWRETVIKEGPVLDPAALAFWLDDATPVQVARRFLWIKTGEDAWRPQPTDKF